MDKNRRLRVNNILGTRVHFSQRLHMDLQALVQLGHKVALGEDFVKGLNSKFGPVVTKMLLDNLQQRLEQEAKSPHMKAFWSDGVNWFKNLLVQALTTQRDTVEGWILSGEDLVTQALVMIFAGDNKALAILLLALKDKLQAREKELTDKAIDQLVATLK